MRTEQEQEHADHMDALTLRISRTMEGERIEHGIMACAACVGFGLVQLTPEQRDQMRSHIETLINHIIESKGQ